MNQVRFLSAVTFTVLSLVWSSAALAQSDTAQIAGLVRDPSGATIASANVVVRNEATGLERRAQSTESGYFSIPSLPPGFYTISVEATGFKKFVKTQNKVDASVTATINAVLEVGALTETIEVIASVANVQTETATVGRVVEGEQIEKMMLNGRNPLFLALLKPGVRGGALSGFSFGLTNGGFSINGARTQDLLITYDGAVGIRTRANGTSVGTADLETVQEIQILTANYNAEYGRSAGGQIRMVSKSGSRDFHGTAYNYFRNDKLDANAWSRNRALLPREASRFNQFGYNISGPVLLPGGWNRDRNKLFFLWSQEWVKRRREITSLRAVPTALMRQGNFSELLGPNIFFNTPITIADPNGNTPFPGNVIPANRVSRNGLGLLRAYPDATPGFIQGSNNFIQTRPQPEDQRKDTISVDFNPTDRQAFRFRHQRYEWVSVDAFRDGFDRAVTDWSRPNRTVSLNHIFTINPTTVNEFTATASVDRVFIGIFRPGGRFERSRYGIDYPYIFPERKEIFDKIPTIQMPNFGTLDGGPYPAQSSGPIYTFANNTTKISGNHTIKFGAYFERLGQNDFDQINVTGVPGGTNNQNGRFVFEDDRVAGALVRPGIVNAALGRFTTYAEIGPRAYTPYRSHSLEFFAQDGWKLSDRLRIEYGIRYTIMQPYYYSLWGNMAVFDPRRYDASRAAQLDRATGNLINPTFEQRYNGVLIPGTGVPDAGRGRVAAFDDPNVVRLFNNGEKYWGQTQKTNFQPRFGVAYSLNSKTVLRGGGGRFLARPGVADNIFLGGNPPFQPMASLANGSVDNPGGAARTFFPQFFMTSDPVFKIPQSWAYSANIQREVGYSTTVEIGYVGRTGLYLERERELNQLQTGERFQAQNVGANVNSLRPFRGFAFIPLGETAARSTYNGLQIDVNRRFTGGFSYGFAYTLSKSMDNASDRRARLYDAFDARSFWGLSNFDSRHLATINFIYELPLLRGNKALAGKLLGGWQMSGVVQFQSGTPFTVQSGDDYSGNGNVDNKPWNASTLNLTYNRQFANCVGAACENNFWFTPTANGQPIFTLPGNGTASSAVNQTRNLFYNPGFQNWNVAGFKDFVITEQHRVQFRAEFFNFPNHPNWSGPDTNPRAANFGKVTGKTSNREIQLSLRYSF